MLTLSDNPLLAVVLASDDRALSVWQGRIRRERDRALTTVDALRLNGFLAPITEEMAKRGLLQEPDSRFALPMASLSEEPWELEPTRIDEPSTWPEDDGLAWMRAPEPSKRDAPDMTIEPCPFCLRVNDGCRIENNRIVCGEDRRRAGRR